MLELIVLGEVPGTQLIITLTWVIVASLMLAGTSGIRGLVRHRHLQQPTTSIDDITL